MDERVYLKLGTIKHQEFIKNLREINPNMFRHIIEDKCVDSNKDLNTVEKEKEKGKGKEEKT